MSEAEYCRCGHAQQIHRAHANPLCRGACGGDHDLDDHLYGCTAGRCPCDGFSPKNRSAA